MNDSLGHVAGDEFLVEVAARLRSCLRSADTAARLGGDEFALLLEDRGGIDRAIDVAERLLVLGPVVEDGPAVEPDHVGQPRDVLVALMRQPQALKQA